MPFKFRLNQQLDQHEAAFQVRKVAEAWWKLAEAIELGDPWAGDKLVALLRITEQAVATLQPQP